MSQLEIDGLIDDIMAKRERHSRARLDLPDWLCQQRPDDYHTRKQTHEAWLMITAEVLDWLRDLKDDQQTVSERKYLNRKREALREVYGSGEYPHADLPTPKEPL